MPPSQVNPAEIRKTTCAHGIDLHQRCPHFFSVLLPPAHVACCALIRTFNS